MLVYETIGGHHYIFTAYYSFINSEGMNSWVGMVKFLQLCL